MVTGTVAAMRKLTLMVGTVLLLATPVLAGEHSHEGRAEKAAERAETAATRAEAAATRSEASARRVEDAVARMDKAVDAYVARHTPKHAVHHHAAKKAATAPATAKPAK